MMSNEVAQEADSRNCEKSKELMVEIESIAENSDGGRNRRATEPMKKTKKLRSIKSLKSSKKWGNSPVCRPRGGLPRYAAASSDELTPVEISDSSSNFIYQNHQVAALRILTRRPSLKLTKTITRMPSKKLKRPVVRKLRGGVDPKKRLKKARSVKLANFASSRTYRSKDDGSGCDQDSRTYSDAEISAHYSEVAISCSSRKIQFQEISHFPEFSINGDQDWKNTRIAKPKILLARNKSLRGLKKSPSLRSSRTITRMANLKSKVHPSQHSNVHQATCSSALKDSRLHDRSKLQLARNESEGVSAKKVCPYTYCSLHGHRHATVPPLKRFVSMRRHVLKTQKSIKPENRVPLKSRRPAKKNKGVQTCESIDAVYQETPIDSVSSSGGPPSERVSTRSPAAADVSEPMEQPSFSREEKKDDSKAESVLVISENSLSTFTNNLPSRAKMEKQKSNAFWHLIYQHMVTGLTAEGETLQVDEENHVKDMHEMHRGNSSGSCEDFSGSDHIIGMEDQDATGKKIEFTKSDAVKLVQQAFDKILSEIPDQSSDDQSIESEMNSEQELELRNCGEGGLSSSTSFSSLMDSEAQGSDEMEHEVKNAIISEEKSKSNGRSKSNQQTPKSWSNLKKLIILKRFVKALEKMKNINPRKPRNLSVEPHPEAGKIHLRHQTQGERKNCEDWMLDYALRKVITTLAPSQKRKVALLVQAFETVMPLPEVGYSPRPETEASSHGTPFQACIHSPVQTGVGIGADKTLRIFHEKILHHETSLKETLSKVSNSCTTKQHIPTACLEIKTENSECCLNKQAPSISASGINDRDLIREEDVPVSCHVDVKNNSMLTDDEDEPVNFHSSVPEEFMLKDESSARGRSAEEIPTKEKLSEVPGEESLVFGLEANKNASEFNPNRSKSVVSLIGTIGEEHNKHRTLKAPNEEGDRPYCGFPPESLPLEECESHHTTDAGHDTKLEKQRYKRLWYLIHKHLSSGNYTEDGIQTTPEEARKEEQNDDNKSLQRRNFDGQSVVFEKDWDINMDTCKANGQKMELHHIEAIKLVEKAIDEIPLPDIQDDCPDDHSINGDLHSDQRVHERTYAEGQRFLTSTSADTSKDSLGESNPNYMQNNAKDLKERSHESYNIINCIDRKTEPKAEDQSKLQPQKNWSNLKKAIMLRRFVKALEKVRKFKPVDPQPLKSFNPAEPRFLPLNSDPEAEKVHLKHQSMEDRKLAEEWMLDYALQQVVSRLNPARKRKVALLVEAFETVMPTA
ncbi:uncharacterized protein LOC110822654 [Carica papaya]|uniref:uncharacterized protein LOC110822654 n=1 Tax=Carica papaya TaxID=3649 RepID=UPI000B8D1A76|nr:uncharacterized protein LOC110822654 [Carica papaya]